MKPFFAGKLATLGTYVYAPISPCLVQATYCAMTRFGQCAEGRAVREYAAVYSMTVGLN